MGENFSSIQIFIIEENKFIKGFKIWKIFKIFIIAKQILHQLTYMLMYKLKSCYKYNQQYYWQLFLSTLDIKQKLIYIAFNKQTY